MLCSGSGPATCTPQARLKNAEVGADGAAVTVGPAGCAKAGWAESTATQCNAQNTPLAAAAHQTRAVTTPGQSLALLGAEVLRNMGRL